MKKMIISIICLILFLASLAWEQEKVEAPVINVGSKWTYRTDTGKEFMIESIGEEQALYIFLVSGTVMGQTGEWTRYYDKKTMNCVKVPSRGEEDWEAKGIIKKYFDFPLYLGKKWSYIYTSAHGMGSAKYVDTIRKRSVVVFEDVNVTAGRFRTIKVKDEQYALGGCHCMTKSYRKFWYWYSPDAKAVVKMERDPFGYHVGYDMAVYGGKYELFSFELR